MAHCEECRVALSDGRGCPYCARPFCADHRLPEKHDCDGVAEWDGRGGRFESGFDGFGDES